MNGKYILVSGSASRSCPPEKLDTAVLFLLGFTEEVLRRGGGVVVLAGGEDATTDERGTPRVFDWLVLRAVERHARRTTEEPRPYALVVMSDDAPESRIDDANLRLLMGLEQRNVVEREHIRRQVFTGGAYRAAMVERADAMLAIGGGKGTYSAGEKMTELAKPVLPLDLQLGSIADDGDGAVALHREMLSDPGRFLPHTHSDVMNRIGVVSLDRGLNEAAGAAVTAAEILDRELQASPAPGWRAGFTRRLTRGWRFANSLPPVAAAIRIADFLRGFF